MQSQLFILQSKQSIDNLFKVGVKLGAGAYGEVYKARKLNYNEARFALKKIPMRCKTSDGTQNDPGWSDVAEDENRKGLDLQLSEFANSAVIDHPFIVSLLGAHY